jgi:uncharacterized protein (DUF2062 family)
MSRVRQFLISQYHRLTQIRDTPHAIAGGVAIGLFIGFTPILGFKTVIAVLIAWLFRFSKLSAALAVTFHDVLLPIWPVILRWQFQIGFLIISRPHRLPPPLSVKHFKINRLFSWDTYFSWKTFHIIWPTFIGSVIMATPLAIISYFVVLEIVTRAHARRAAAAPP